MTTLKEQLAAKDRDLVALKKQAGQNVSAFNELADSVSRVGTFSLGVLGLIRTV